jgi:2-C-methyl-D-erythritol 4-phosphate cytidylyltransferase
MTGPDPQPNPPNDAAASPAYAVLAAAGAGSRMGQNKQLLELGGQTVIGRTLSAFARCRHIRGIVIVAAAADLQAIAVIVAGLASAKVLALVAGGLTRLDSVARGLTALAGSAALSDDSPVLIHDGARCFVSQALIERVIDGIICHRACGAALPVRDTIKQVAADRRVLATPARDRLWAMQTPQGAIWSDLADAYRQAAAQGWQATDDLAVLEQAGYPAWLVEGDERNIKLTTPQDLIVGESLARTEAAGG